ncbi:hypothetical protein Ancab_020963 [Ancistrocladus abbreviatus]
MLDGPLQPQVQNIAFNIAHVFTHRDTLLSSLPRESLCVGEMLRYGPLPSSPLPFLKKASSAHHCHRHSATVSSQLITAAATTGTGTGIGTFTVSDRELESRGFTLHRTIDTLNLDHLNSVFVAVGFPRRDPQKIRVALENTHSLLWIEYVKTQRPVAFARATGDGVFNAIIWDVVVDPTFQGIGLGKAVMERIIDELLRKGITNIALYSEPRVLGFYRPLGFVADPDGIRGMYILLVGIPKHI